MRVREGGRGVFRVWKSARHTKETRLVVMWRIAVNILNHKNYRNEGKYSQQFQEINPNMKAKSDGKSAKK